MIHVISVL